MNNKTIYYNKNTNQVSLDQQEWVDLSGYGNYDDPYFTLNEREDWCSIRTSRSGEWLICFVKEQPFTLDNHQEQAVYYQGFFKVNELINDIATFNCYQVIKNSMTGKWEKAPDNYQDGDFLI